MKQQKHLLIALALIALFGVNACRRNSAPSEPSPAATADESARQHAEGGAATAIETRFFKGSIGTALGMRLKLMREGDKLNGSYSYQKVGKKIDVRGTVDQGGNVTLEEFDPAGKQTGIFKGVWKLDQDGVVEISGDWTKPSGEKKTKFSLHQEPIEFTSSIEIVSRQIKENNKKLRYEINIDYPQLTGSADPNVEKFNQTVRNLMNKRASEFRKDMIPEPEGERPSEERPDEERPANEPDPESVGSDINIEYSFALAKDDLISVEFTVSSYSAGAAHPNSHTEVVNFNLKNGKLLKLADLFLPGSKYLQTLSTACIQALTKQAQAEGPDGMLDEAWIQRGAAPELTNYEGWTITKKGLGVTFDPYMVAAYAAGPQHVVAPYSALKGIIKPDGPVGQFVK